MKRTLAFAICLIFLPLASFSISNSEASHDLVDVSFGYQGFREDLGEEVHIELNRVYLQDNQIISQGETIFFSFTYDVADSGLNQYGYDSQVNYWFYDIPDMYGIYNETRLLGKFNIFFDEYDLGTYRWWEGSPDTLQYITLQLAVGWHYVTVIAAEYESDNTHSLFDWKWKKDQIKFYVSATEIEEPPEIIYANNNCNYKANMTNAEDFLSPYPFFIPFINPYNELPEGKAGLKSQEITDENVNAKAQINFNVTLYDEFALESYHGYAVFQNSTTMGKGEFGWFMNDGDIQFELEGAFKLVNGQNYVCFVSIGFGVEIDNYIAFHPRVAFSTKVYSISNEIPITESSLSVIVSVLAILALTSISLIKNK